MSRAFVREGEGEPEPLPERVVSAHPNFVTARGLAQIESEVHGLEAARTAAQSARRTGGAASDAAALASIERDLRYWKQRQATARLIEPAATPAAVRFGVTAQLRDEAGATHVLKLVGEDEAAPTDGFLSWVSPFATALMGAEEGDVVPFGGTNWEVEALS